MDLSSPQKGARLDPRSDALLAGILDGLQPTPSPEPLSPIQPESPIAQPSKKQKTAATRSSVPPSDRVTRRQAASQTASDSGLSKSAKRTR